MIGTTDYRNGARERMEDAYELLIREQFGGCIYLAGRAVEGMLRAIIWKADGNYARGTKSLETGHDLRDLLKVARDLGLFPAQSSIVGDVQHIGRLWSNNMRFWPTTKVHQMWRHLGQIRKTMTLKKATAEYYDACSAVIKRCEAVWQR